MHCSVTIFPSFILSLHSRAAYTISVHTSIFIDVGGLLEVVDGVGFVCVVGDVVVVVVVFVVIVVCVVVDGCVVVVVSVVVVVCVVVVVWVVVVVETSKSNPKLYPYQSGGLMSQWRCMMSNIS